MDPLQPHRVHEAGGIAHDQRTVRVAARDGVPAAFGQRLRAVAHHLPAVEQTLHQRVLLVVIESDVRIEHRILVVEADHEAERDLPLRHRVDEAAAELLEAQRIAHRVDHRAGRHAVRRNFPQFLDPNREERRMPARAELEGMRQLLREVAAHAVGEDRHLRVDVDAGLEGRLRLAVLPAAAIPGSHAEDPVALHQHVRAGKTREEIDPFRFHEAGEPLDEFVQ